MELEHEDKEKFIKPSSKKTLGIEDKEDRKQSTSKEKPVKDTSWPNVEVK